MKCDFDSERCKGDPLIHLRRVRGLLPHPDSRPGYVVCVILDSDDAGRYCAKHALQLMRVCGDLYIDHQEKP